MARGKMDLVRMSPEVHQSNTRNKPVPLHIVDSQSFPLVVPEMPELSAKGAYAKDQVYTPNDVRDIVKYAAVVSVLLAAPITRDADHTRLNW